MTDEELDEARVEEAYRLHAVGDFMTAMEAAAMLGRTNWQPTPAVDPLVEAIKDMDSDTLSYQGPCGYVERLRHYLAKHNLAIVEIARTAITPNLSISAGEEGKSGPEDIATIDPLVLEAREICASDMANTSQPKGAQEYREGLRDSWPQMKIALAGLKRGMEIAREDKSDMLEAVMGLGAMPEGYCFCSKERIGDDSKVHEPECADLRAAIAEATGELT